MILDHKESTVYYTDEGQGEVVVLLHGFLENSTMWSELKPMLLNNNRIICIDLLGHGQTPCLGYVHTMSAMADAILAVIKHLDIAKFKVIGHSMGGYVALALAEKIPKAILGVCLMNSTYHADDEAQRALRKRANKMAQTNFESMVRMSVTNLFSSESRSAHNLKIETVLEQALKTSPQGYIAGQEGMMLRENKLEFFKELKAHKLIVIGQKDPVVKGDLIVQEIKNTDIDFKKLSFGHMSHIESKEELSYILKRFIEFKYL